MEGWSAVARVGPAGRALLDVAGQVKVVLLPGPQRGVRDRVDPGERELLRVRLVVAAVGAPGRVVSRGGLFTGRPDLEYKTRIEEDANGGRLLVRKRRRKGRCLFVYFVKPLDLARKQPKHLLFFKFLYKSVERGFMVSSPDIA